MSRYPRRSARELVERGYVTEPAALLRVHRETVADGPAAGTRVLVVVATDGLTLRILLDRGMDLGEAWFDGVPVAWLSAVGETRPGRVDGGQGWLDGWPGGLLTTCGLRNVGAPSDGHGQHGSYTDLAATNVACAHRWLDDGELAVDVTGDIVDASSLGSRLVLHRRITVVTGSGTVEVVDSVTNAGHSLEQAPVLYHVNFGAPMLSETSIATLPGRTVAAPTDPVVPWGRMGPPAITGEDEIVEHIATGETVPGEFSVTGPSVGLVGEVRWDASVLNRVHTWQRRRPGSYVMSVEPANCSLGGRAADRQAGRAPFLAPGETRRSGVTIRFRRDDPPAEL